MTPDAAAKILLDRSLQSTVIAPQLLCDPVQNSPKPRVTLALQVHIFQPGCSARKSASEVPAQTESSHIDFGNSAQ